MQQLYSALVHNYVCVGFHFTSKLRNFTNLFHFRAQHFPVKYNITMTTVKIFCPSLSPSMKRVRGDHSVRGSGASGRNSFPISWQNYRASAMGQGCHFRRYVNSILSPIVPLRHTVQRSHYMGIGKYFVSCRKKDYIHFSKIDLL